jgi:RimJ/RimL family protein N-acetyltransferase
MRIRTIYADELAKFTAVSTRAEDVETIHNYLNELPTRGSTHYDWCFVIEEGMRPLGRVAYWAQPASAIPRDVILLDVPWTENFLYIGTQLLHETAQIMRQHGATDLSHTLDLPPRPPQWQHVPEQRHTLLTQVGFNVIRETRRFEWRANTPVPHGHQHVVFRQLPDVGETVFLDALEQVMQSALDQRTQADRAEYGSSQAAKEFFTLCASIGYDPQWWQIAYTPSRDLIGIVMPAGTAAWATIGYIGVIPAQRGHGYIDDLLAQATHTLTTIQSARIEADTDVANTPMANALLRTGWVEFGKRREYRWRTY